MICKLDREILLFPSWDNDIRGHLGAADELQGFLCIRHSDLVLLRRSLLDPRLAINNESATLQILRLKRYFWEIVVEPQELRRYTKKEVDRE